MEPGLKSTRNAFAFVDPPVTIRARLHTLEERWNER